MKRKIAVFIFIVIIIICADFITTSERNAHRLLNGKQGEPNNSEETEESYFNLIINYIYEFSD